MDRQRRRYLPILLSLSCLVVIGAILVGVRAALHRSPYPHGSVAFRANSVHVSGIAFSKDGSCLAAVGWDNNLRLFNVATGKMVRQWVGPDRPHIDIAFAPDHPEIAVTTDMMEVSRWDTETGKEKLPRLAPIATGGFVRYSPDGKLIAASSRETGIVDIWDTTTGNVRRILLGHVGYAGDLCFLPDSKRLITADRKGIHLWDIASGELIRSWPGDYVTFVAVSPNGEQVAFGGPLTRVQLVSLRDNQQPVTLSGTDIQHGVFSSDGRYLLAAQDGDILAYDLKGHLRSDLAPSWHPPGFMMRIFPKLRNLKRLPINCLAVSPDGRLLAYSFGNNVVLQPMNHLKIP